jgi:hypothetical protein
MPDPKQTCATCTYWRNPYCCRFPPTVAATGWTWPTVLGSAWCGEWQKVGAVGTTAPESTGAPGPPVKAGP